MSTSSALGTHSPSALVEAYVAGWNAHDGSAVLATFADGGTYEDPTLPGPIGGEDLVGYITGLATAFPDLHFDVEGLAVDGDEAFLRWRMRGTNTGPMPGAPEPSNGTCDLPGIDVITVGESGIVRVVGYFDQKTLGEQLGL